MALFKPRILYEDDHLLAVDKPAGMASVPAPHIAESKTLQGKVRAWALAHAKGFKPYLLNRLDRPTSGVVLLGKFPRDRTALENIFQHPSTRKTYLALVKGIPHRSEGTIRLPLEARQTKEKISAVTHYRIRERYPKTSLLEVVIETGRQHQIRKHLAAIGHPLVMDKLYGKRNFNHNYLRQTKGRGQMLLHAWQVEFDHPFTKTRSRIECPLGKLQ